MLILFYSILFNSFHFTEFHFNSFHFIEFIHRLRTPRHSPLGTRGIGTPKHKTLDPPVPSQVSQLVLGCPVTGPHQARLLDHGVHFSAEAVAWSHAPAHGRRQPRVHL
jgi:hypothetical protein